MKRIPSLRLVLAALAVGLFWAAAPGLAAEKSPAQATLDALSAPEPPVFTRAEGAEEALDILGKVRERHKGVALCARFTQVSVLSGMGMEDEASGNACFQYPDKMRWSYEQPESQLVVSDGMTFWIYRPADRQAMKGDAEKIMGPGQGGSFLSDPAVLSKNFTVTMAPDDWVKKHGRPETWALKLVPKKPRPEFSELYLFVDKGSYRIQGSVSFNPYGDWTRILFSEFAVTPGLGPESFSFTPPPGTDVAGMDGSESF